MSTACRLLLAIAMVASCERRPQDVDEVEAPGMDAAAETEQQDVAVAPPWRMTGRLLGATASHAIVLADGIVSVDIETGDVRARAVTAAEDPVPTFDRHLPRLGIEEREAQPVDRLTDMPVYVGGEVVVFMRGSDDVVTSLVGLDTTTLEEAWTLAVAYRRPVRSCRTDNGVLMIPQSPQPARFVDWLGQQAWLREFGRGELQNYRCGKDRVQVLMKSGRKHELRSYDSGTGDLVDKSKATSTTELTIESVAPAYSGVAQVGDEVVHQQTPKLQHEEW